MLCKGSASGEANINALHSYGSLVEVSRHSLHLRGLGIVRLAREIREAVTFHWAPPNKAAGTLRGGAVGSTWNLHSNNFNSTPSLLLLLELIERTGCHLRFHASWDDCSLHAYSKLARLIATMQEWPLHNVDTGNASRRDMFTVSGSTLAFSSSP